MEKVNNKNEIEMYYEIEEDYPQLVIYDSNKNYFNDIILEEEDFEENFKSLIDTIENTDLNNMCAFFGHKLYDNICELAKEQDLDYKEIDPLQNDYVNVFRVKDKEFYTWCWG